MAWKTIRHQFDADGAFGKRLFERLIPAEAVEEVV
jgi:hypothetical protein